LALVLPIDPTAMQELSDVQATAANELLFVPSSGLETIDQVVPFHISVKVLTMLLLLLVDDPTAMQESSDVHATPDNELLSVPTSGLETIDQAVPFHVSISVWLTPLLLS
jgi:hypothetical protein